jgi:hypothetical protein
MVDAAWHQFLIPRTVPGRWNSEGVKRVTKAFETRSFTRALKLAGTANDKLGFTGHYSVSEPFGEWFRVRVNCSDGTSGFAGPEMVNFLKLHDLKGCPDARGSWFYTGAELSRTLDIGFRPHGRRLSATLRERYRALLLRANRLLGKRV